MVKVFRFDNPKRERQKQKSPSNASIDGILNALRRINSNDNSSSDGEAHAFDVTPSSCGSDGDGSCQSGVSEDNKPVDAVIVASSGGGSNNDSQSVPDSFQEWGKFSFIKVYVG